MQKTVENKLSKLIHEIRELEKELILKGISKKEISKQRITRWKALGEKVSAKWDKISAVEEVSMQREKSW